MISLCIWMNIPSHYQSAFYAALAAREDVDLIICYFQEASADRAAEGWADVHDYAPYEISCADAVHPEEMLRQIPDWRERTHILSSNFSAELVAFLCEKRAAWCHWSEMPGIRLAELVGYRMALFRALNPATLALKQSEGRCIRRFALGALGQGRLARRAFRTMGVPAARCADLFYAPAALPKLEPSGRVVDFADGRKVFLAVGALCERKGIDVLLRAFARLDAPEWCVVLCGLDKASGSYQRLAESLGLSDQILFLGAYPSERIGEVYAAADVFVIPSRFDGWGAVLNEAASVGLPLVGTDLCGGSWHAIEPGRNGFRARAGSAVSLAAALSPYVADPELLAPHGAASREIFSRELTPERNAERLVEAVRAWGPHEG